MKKEFKHTYELKQKLVFDKKIFFYRRITQFRQEKKAKKSKVVIQQLASEFQKGWQIAYE